MKNIGNKILKNLFLCNAKIVLWTFPFFSTKYFQKLKNEPWGHPWTMWIREVGHCPRSMRKVFFLYGQLFTSGWDGWELWFSKKGNRGLWISQNLDTKSITTVTILPVIEETDSNRFYQNRDFLLPVIADVPKHHRKLKFR